MTNVYPKSTENLGIPSGDWSDVEDFAEKKIDSSQTGKSPFQ